MMNNKLWLRVISLVLASVCLISVMTAAAADLGGNVTLWDLQKAVSDNKTNEEKASLLEALLGNPDELHPNAENVYEIWSELGLRNMAKMTQDGIEGGKTFKLMKDIDLNGGKWATTTTFAGVLDGNGHVISNFTVNKDFTFSNGLCVMGFLGKLHANGVVRNLKLENVTVQIPENSRVGFVGLLVGSVIGQVENCTTVGEIIDPRTDLSNINTKNENGAICYMGTLAGRIENVDSAKAILVSDESILMTAESAEVSAISGMSQKVLCKMGLDLAELKTPSDGLSYKRKLGIVGWAPGTAGKENSKWPEAYDWQDISGACTVTGGTKTDGTVNTYQLEDPILVARRQTTVDKMYEICTVQWTPSQDLMRVYYKIGTGDEKGKLKFERKIWEAGTTYYGMPYNHGSGSLERFYAYTEAGANGVRKTVSELPLYSFYYTHTDVLNAMNTNGANATCADNNYTVYGRTNTAELISKGLLTASGNVITGYSNIIHNLSCGYDAAYVGDQPITDTVKNGDHAGFSRYIGNDCSQAIQWAWREVVSSDAANGGTVISGVGQMCPSGSNPEKYGVVAVGNIVPASYSVKDVETIYSKASFMEAYAQASRGDALICDQTAGGHSRMIAYDPICIRNYKGDIYIKKSYIITHEQGGAAKEGYNTTCNWDRVMTFNDLLDDDDHKNNNSTENPGVNCSHYFPTSINAFHDVDSKAVTSYVTYSGGVVNSNFYIVSTKVVGGNEVFTAIGQHRNLNHTNYVGSGYRDAHVRVDLAATHGDLTDKEVIVLLSNGDTYTVNCNTGEVAKTN